MANSMTGFGRAEAQWDGRTITVELKSVNHRYLDVGMRLPRNLNFLEDTIRTALSKKLTRGHVDVFVNYVNHRGDAKTVTVDQGLVAAYMAAANSIRAAADIDEPLRLAELMRLPDVLTVTEEEEDREQIAQLCRKAAEQAADALIVMRRAEGERLCADITARCGALRRMVEKIALRAPAVVNEYRQKLACRLEELLGGVEVDQQRLANEVAILADKANIDEEIVRLGSHIEQTLALLSSGGEAGRKLDFIVQEMNREANTIGSKAGDIAILDTVISCKAEIEKIREQIQNIE